MDDQNTQDQTQGQGVAPVAPVDAPVQPVAGGVEEGQVAETTDSQAVAPQAEAPEAAGEEQPKTEEQPVENNQ